MTLSEASYEMTNGAFQKQNEADQKLFVQFNYHPHKNEEKTAEAGRPIYEDRVYVMIIVPGDKDSIVHRPAYPRDFERFPKQYQAFQNKSADAIIGTPLSSLTWLSASQVKELEYFGIRTVEHLATVNDNVAGKFHGLQSLKQRAADFVAAAKDAAPMLEMRKQLEQRDEQLAILQKQMAELMAKIDSAPKEAKPTKAA